MIKSKYLTAALISLAISPMLCAADSNTKVNLGYNTKPTYIHNTTAEDLAYIVRGDTAFNKTYTVRRKSTDEYHAGVGDEHAIIEVGICKKISALGCDDIDNMKACTKSHYDINEVSDITISAGHECVIRCRDGSNSSCKRL